MHAVVLGASIAGLTSALALARSGVDVLVLDPDDSTVPDPLSPDFGWDRRGVPQHTQAHAFLSLFIKTMNELAPGFVHDLVRQGAIQRSAEQIMPSGAFVRKGEINSDLSEIRVINARRPFVEAMLRQRVLQEPNIGLKIGEAKGLSSRSLDGIPHVTGVVLASDEKVSADVVIDATGRRSGIDEWLKAIGARAPFFVMEPANQLYFSRYHRLLSSDSLPPLNNGFVTVSPFPWFVVLMFPGDNGTIQIAMGGLPEETHMKKVRQEESFQAVAQLAPDVASWVDPKVSQPFTSVSAMGNLNNHLRRLVVDEDPVATGIHLVGDSVAITNPQYGRGVSHAAGHASSVAKAILDHPDDPRKQALIVDAEVQRMLVPSFETSVRSDRSRTRLWRPPRITESSIPKRGHPRCRRRPGGCF